MVPDTPSVSLRRRVSVGLVAGWVGLLSASATVTGTLIETARENAAQRWVWTDRTQTLELTIVDGRGNERVRKLRMLSRRDSEGGEQSLAVFTAPPDTRGTAFLQHDRPGEPASTWSYLPELGRTRRVSTASSRRRFMGTDFSYADLRLIEQALRWGPKEVSTEPEAGSSTRFVLRPEGGAPYDRIVLELAQPDGRMQSIEMFDEGQETPTKVLTFGDIRDVSGIPTAFEMRLRQPANGTETRVSVSNVAYGVALDDAVFAPTDLDRAMDHVD